MSSFPSSSIEGLPSHQRSVNAVLGNLSSSRSDFSISPSWQQKSLGSVTQSEVLVGEDASQFKQFRGIGFEYLSEETRCSFPVEEFSAPVPQVIGQPVEDELEVEKEGAALSYKRNRWIPAEEHLVNCKAWQWLGLNVDQNSDHPRHNTKFCRFIFASFFLIEIFVNYDCGAIPAALSTISSEFNLTKTWQGTLGALPYVGLTVASPVAGRFLQYRSPKQVVLWTMVMNVVASILLTISIEAWMMLSSRLLCGLTQAAFVIYAPVWVDEFAPETKVTLWMGLIQGATVVGVTVGYLIAGFIAHYGHNWRWSIVIQNIILSVLVGTLYYLPVELIDLYMREKDMKQQPSLEAAFSADGRSSRLNLKKDAFSEVSTPASMVVGQDPKSVQRATNKVFPTSKSAVTTPGSASPVSLKSNFSEGQKSQHKSRDEQENAVASKVPPPPFKAGMGTEVGNVDIEEADGPVKENPVLIGRIAVGEGVFSSQLGEKNHLVDGGEISSSDLYLASEVVQMPHEYTASNRNLSSSERNINHIADCSADNGAATLVDNCHEIPLNSGMRESIPSFSFASADLMPPDCAVPFATAGGVLLWDDAVHRAYPPLSGESTPVSSVSPRHFHLSSYVVNNTVLDSASLMSESNSEISCEESSLCESDGKKLSRDPNGQRSVDEEDPGLGGHSEALDEPGISSVNLVDSLSVVEPSMTQRSRSTACPTLTKLDGIHWSSPPSFFEETPGKSNVEEECSDGDSSRSLPNGAGLTEKDRFSVRLFLDQQNYRRHSISAGEDFIRLGRKLSTPSDDPQHRESVSHSGLLESQGGRQCLSEAKPRFRIPSSAASSLGENESLTAQEKPEGGCRVPISETPIVTRRLSHFTAVGDNTSYLCDFRRTHRIDNCISHPCVASSPSGAVFEAMQVAAGVDDRMELHVGEDDGSFLWPSGREVQMVVHDFDESAITASATARNALDVTERAFVSTDVRHKAPTSWQSLCGLARSPIYIWTVFTLCAMLFVVTGVQFWATRFFTEFLHVEPWVAMTSFSATAATGPTAGVLIGGCMIDRLGGYKSKTGMFKALFACTVLATLAFVTGVIAGIFMDYLVIIICIWFLLFFGGAMLPPLTGILIAAVDVEIRAFASGFSMFLYNVFGYALGTFLPGVIMDIFGAEDQIGMRLILMWSLFAVLGVVMATWSAKSLNLKTEFRTLRSAEKFTAHASPPWYESSGSESPLDEMGYGGVTEGEEA